MYIMAAAVDLFQTFITAVTATDAAAAAVTAVAVNQSGCVRYTREELLSLNSPSLKLPRRVRKLYLQLSCGSRRQRELLDSPAAASAAQEYRRRAWILTV